MTSAGSDKDQGPSDKSPRAAAREGSGIYGGATRPWGAWTTLSPQGRVDPPWIQDASVAFVVAGGADPGVCVALSGRTGTKTKERPIAPSKKINVNAGNDFIPPFRGRATSGDERSVVAGGADPGGCVTLSGRTGTKTKERPISPSKKINVNAGNDFIPPFPGRATSGDERSVVAGRAEPGALNFLKKSPGSSPPATTWPARAHGSFAAQTKRRCVQRRTCA